MPDMELARYAIDMLGVVEEKTRGNLSTAETQLLEVTLHDLRMAYLDATRVRPAGDAPAAGEPASGGGKSRIITP